MKIKEIRLILGDQLNINHSWFETVDPTVLYVLMEVKSESEYVTHHIQKVVGIFAAMRAFAQEIKARGHEVRYFPINDPDNHHDFLKNIEVLCVEHGISKVSYQLPDEYRLDQYFKHSKFPLIAVDSEHFLTHREEVATLFKGKKMFLMETFYRHMRKKHEVLMEGDQPVGGQWNFDHENRKKLPAKSEILTTPLGVTDQTTVYQDIHQAQLKTIGAIDPLNFSWTVTREAAVNLLQEFMEQALPLFGTYQDAMTTQHWYVYHSRLSFALNVKLIGPMEVIRAVEQAYNTHPNTYELNQIEGFIRQILGWREYMRGIYWAKMPDFSELNYFGNEAKLPSWYWTGETKMNCLHHAIKQSLDHAYAHHIQRLMVTGNFASLLGVHPDEVDRWYLGIYIDAFEWVEITNTRGMSQFADGGIVGSKPYVSSAAYVQKMSNYCDGCYYHYKDKFGEKGCPFNTLYWDFYDRNRSLLERNPRIGMMYKVWDKMEAPQKQLILEKAQEIKQNIEQV
ncbi:MAG: cryptochrome/photolyase family protein [Flavobacteriales bacterium]